MSERDELERLRRENLELDAQLKQLVRAERELYVARRTSERQLRQMRTLSDFAIRVSALVGSPWLPVVTTTRASFGVFRISSTPTMTPGGAFK